MGVFLNNQIIDIKDTPGITADNTVSANNYNVGTILFDTGLNSIFRNEGTPGSQSWVGYGGSGGTPNLDQVLNVGNTSSLDIDLTSTGQLHSFFNGGNLIFYKDNLENIFSDLNYDYLELKNDDVQHRTQTDRLYYRSNVATDTIQMIFDVFTELTISTSFNNIIKGLKIDYQFNAYSFGDFDNNVNGTSIIIDDANQILNINGSVTTATAGSNSGQHLQVTINGTPYVIELRNP